MNGSARRPSVDVVIPCYKYAHFLEFCVGTVLSQRDVDVRVLIVDDQSPDNTPAVAESICRRDARVEYTRNERNLGLVGSANRGVIDWARAEYTLLLSADDAITPGALARAASVMDRFPEVGVTYGMALVAAETGEMQGVQDQHEFEYRVMPGTDFLRRACLLWCGVASPTALVRTSVQHEVGGLDPNLPHTCDMEIWMRIATRASIAAINATQAYYRRHDGNMSIAYMTGPLSDLREQLATATSVLINWGGHIPEAQEWLRAMKSRMVDQACWMASLAFERGDDKNMAECMAFAAELQPSLWTRPSWVRFQSKRLAGRSLMRLVRDRTGDRAWPSPFKRGQLFGWWPQTETSGVITA